MMNLFESVFKNIFEESSPRLRSLSERNEEKTPGEGGERLWSLIAALFDFAFQIPGIFKEEIVVEIGNKES